MNSQVLKKYIKDIPNFPIDGIIYKDMSPLLNNDILFRKTIRQMSDVYFKHLIDEYDKVVGIESGGFIFGASLANELKKCFIRIRKPGKLPNETISEKYDLEYGSNELHIQKCDIEFGDRVILVDDCLATTPLLIIDSQNL